MEKKIIELVAITKGLTGNSEVIIRNSSFCDK